MPGSQSMKRLGGKEKGQLKKRADIKKKYNNFT